MRVDETRCLGEQCGCNRLCTRVFRCPGLVWDKAKNKSRLDEVICTGCGRAGNLSGRPTGKAAAQ